MDLYKHLNPQQRKIKNALDGANDAIRQLRIAIGDSPYELAPTRFDELAKQMDELQLTVRHTLIDLM